MSPGQCLGALEMLQYKFAISSYRVPDTKKKMPCALALSKTKHTALPQSARDCDTELRG